MHPIGPPLRQELVQQDHAPAQREERIEQAKPNRKSRIGAIHLRRSIGEASLQRFGQGHARVEQEIRNELYRIVPAEIVEIDKHEPPIRPPQRIMEAEIGRTQRTTRILDLMTEAEPVFAIIVIRPAGNGAEKRFYLAGEKA